jgi:hypothetical protein
MKWFLFLIIFSISSKLFACECVAVNFDVRYQTSDFIATAKILSVSDVEENSDYRKIEIEILELYKGNHVTYLKELSPRLKGCGIFTPKNTIWLIFATYDRNGTLNFALCSGSMQIDSIPDHSWDPNYKQFIKSKIQRTLEILTYLKSLKLSNINEHGLVIDVPLKCIYYLGGHEANKQRFAVYEISVSKNLSITKVKTLKTFDNKELSQNLLACIKNEAKVNTEKLKEIPFKSKVIVIYFYHPGEQSNPGFLTKYLY